MARVVRPNQALCQFQSEVLEGYLPDGRICDRLEVPDQDKGVNATAVEQKPEDVSIEFSGLAPDWVVVS